MKALKISLIGSGRVARFLGHKFYHAGHHILDIYSRHESNVASLAKQLHAQPVKSLAQMRPGADIYLIAVKDDAVKEVAQGLMLKDELIAHTSGAVEHDVLMNASTSYGVFYPFQSISMISDPVRTLSPVSIYGESERTIQRLERLADSIGQQSVVLNDSKRLQLHLVAVFLNNFTNHMGTIANQLALQGQIPFNLLHPMIEVTLKHLKENPSGYQTGPAIRNDVGTMNRHLEILSENPLYREIYEVISKSIQATHNAKQQ